MKPLMPHWIRSRRSVVRPSPRRGLGRAALRKFFRPVIESLEDRTLLNAVSWISTSSGFWDVASNWSTGQVPTAADDVTINQPGVTVTVRSGGQAAHSLLAQDPLILSGGNLILGDGSQLNAGLTFSGGEFDLVGSVTLAGASQWTGSGLNLVGHTLTNIGTLTLANSADVSMYANGNFPGGDGRIDLGGTLANQGTIVQQGAGSVVLFDSVVVANQRGATYSFAADGGIKHGNRSPAVNNLGTFQKTGGTGTSTIGEVFNNQGGTIAVTSGTLTPTGGGASTGGTFTVAQGATLDLSGNTGIYTGAYTGSGAGTVRLQGTIVIGAAGATFNFPAGLFQWTGGGLNLAGHTLTNLGTLTLANAADVGLFANGNFPGGDGRIDLGGTLANQGTIVQQGGGSVVLFDSVAVTNQRGATYSFAADSGIKHGNDSPAVNNLGTLQKTGGTGTSTIGEVFNNQGGAITVNTGTLTPAGGGVSTGGTFTVAQGATLDLSGNNGIYTGAYTGSEAGTVRLQGTIVIGAAGATFNFPAGLFQWTGGGLNLAGHTLTNLGTLTLANAADVGLFANGNFPGGDGRVDLGGTLANQGTIVQQGAGSVVLFDSVVLTNQSGATYSFAADGGIKHGNRSPAVNNLGTFQKTGGIGTSTIGEVFNNQGGAITMSAGTLTLAGGGASTGGTFTVAQGATLDLTGGNGATYTGFYTGSGAGTIALSSGTLAIGVGGGSFNFPGNLFQWSGGNINSAVGDLTNLGTITLAGSNEKIFFNDGTFDNKGTIIQTGSGNLGLHSDNQFPTTLKNEAGALYTIAGDSGIDNPFGGQTVVVNAGTIQKTAGSGTSTLFVNGSLSNTGTVEADAGTLSLAASISQLSSTTLTAGTWKALNGATLALPGGSTIATNQATITLSGAGAALGGLSALASNAGILTFTNGAGLTTAGNLANTGTGTLTLGPGSKLTVHGTYTQGAAATLQVQLGGVPASGQFGQLAASSAAALGGTLDVVVANGYSPAASDRFQVVTFTSATGSFAAIKNPLFHGGNLFQVLANPTDITVAAATAIADLKVTSVSAGPNPVLTGQNLTVNYAVKNQGNATPVSSWVDAVFLSASGRVDASAVLLGRVPHTGAVAANGTYSGTLTVPVPPVLSGNYFLVVEVDSQGLVPDANRGNTVLAMAAPVLVTVPTLPLSPAGGTLMPVTGTAVAGQPVVYAVDDPTGADFTVNLAIRGNGGTTLLVTYQALPTADNAVLAVGLTFQGQNAVQGLLVQHGQVGAYYVGFTWQGAPSSVSYTLSASAVALSVSTPAPNAAPASDHVTLTIRGTGFTRGTRVSLVSGQTTVTANQVLFEGAGALAATFNLANTPPGKYAVVVSDNGHSASTDAVFIIFPPSATDPVLPGNGSIRGFLDAPSAVRPGVVYSLTVNYRSEELAGLTVQAPILLLSADNGAFQLPGQTGFTPGSIMLLGINSSGEAGTLSGTFVPENCPQVGSCRAAHYVGEFQSIQVNFKATAPGTVHFKLGVAGGGAAIDWNSIKPSLQPSGVSNAAWDAIFANFTSVVGNTMGGLQTALDKDANYLSQLGEYTPDANRLLAFQLEQAGNFGAIAQRYAPGIFGLGIPDPTLQAVTDSHGNVNILSGSVARPFTRQPDGSYQAAPGDFATLTLASGIYQVRETNGTLEVFNANGSLNFIQDVRGNKTMYGYTGAQLTSITNTATGDVTAFRYNAQALVGQITDPEGRITGLSYDTAGHLLSLTNPLGTTRYTYVTSGTPQQLNALASITNPDGAQVFFTYNSQGQLIGQSQNVGAIPLTFSYDVGVVTVTDALNHKTTAFLNENGQIARLIDPLGNIIQGSFNRTLELASLQEPSGSTSLAYDAMGNPISVIDPLGHKITATYNPTFNALATITDPLNHTLNYSYDPSNGNLLGITYPDGSSQRYAYDAVGNVTRFINRNGQAIGYSYYPNGLRKTRTYPDGTQDSFTYDGHRNLVSMMDATGTTSFSYDSADRLTKVTYPDGSFLQYTYNTAGQRIQMKDQTGFTVNYQYDALGRLSTLTDAGGNLIVFYSYGSVGRLASKHFGNGTTTNYTYDAAGNVLNIVNLAPNGSTQSSYVYTYNNQNLPITMTTSAGTFAYGYDAVGQLTSVRTPAGRTITYRYDAAGNRVAVVDNGNTTQYTANDLNEYTQVGGTTYMYDTDGELVSRTDSTGTTTYRYNVLGQLVSVVSPAGATTYQYNALGQLVSENVNGTVTKLLNDPTGLGKLVGQFTANGSPIAQYAYGLGLVSQTTPSGSSNFYSFDLTGNTTQLTGPTGSVLNAYSYLPFGEQISATGSTPNPFTYVGQFGVMNDASGLFYMRNRWYDPSLGRFTKPDPLGLGAGEPNLFRYVGNNPTDRIDPSGLIVETLAITTAVDLLNGVFGPVTAGVIVQTGFGVATGTTTAQGILNFANASQGVAAVEAAATPAEEVAIFEGTNVQGILGWIGGAGAGGAEAGFVIPVVPAAAFVFITTFTVTRIISSQTGFDKLVTDALEDFFITRQDVLVHVPSSHDPNEITGPGGFGPAGFVSAGNALSYRIDFENDPKLATAPAATVVVTQQLDPSLDLSTFQLGDIGFGTTVIHVPAGLTSYHTRILLPATAPGAGPDGLFVDVSASLNFQTGLVTWTFTSLDPDTMDLPINPFEGFLPPDKTAPEGEGFVSYTVQAKASATTGTLIKAQATVVFDQNAAINTKQVANALDGLPPSSHVNPLPDVTPNATFTVSWSGQDDAGGSGVAFFDVFVSVDGGPFQPFLTHTTQTSATFTGVLEHHYSFFSVATDNVGNREATPIMAQATTFISHVAAISFAVSPPVQPITAGASFTLTVRALRFDGQVATGFTGTVHFSSTNALDALPADYTFTAADQGVHTFTVTLLRAGRRTIAVTAGSLTGSTGVTVIPIALENVFVIGLDHQVYAHKFDVHGHPVGGYFLTQPGVVKSLTVGHTPDDNPELFVLGLDNQVYAQKFDANGNSASGYFLVQPGQVKAVTVGYTANGNPELFVIGLDDQVYAQKLDANGNPAGGYFLVQVGHIKQLVVGADAAQHPEIFVRGLDDQVYAQKLDAAGNAVGSYFLTQRGQVKDLAVTHDAANRPELFVIGLDHQVYAQKFDAAGNSASGYFLTQPGQVKALSASHNAADGPELFVIGLDDQVYAQKFDGTGNSASGYFLTQPGHVKSLDTGFDAAGNPELFVQGLDDQVWAQLFDSAGSSLGGYFLMDGGQVKALSSVTGR